MAQRLLPRICSSMLEQIFSVALIGDCLPAGSPCGCRLIGARSPHVRGFPYAWLRTAGVLPRYTSNRKDTPWPPPPGAPAAVAGIDSHKDTLAACVIDEAGRPVEHQTFDNTPQGHRKAIGWLRRHDVGRVGIEGSGSYGRPLAVRLAAQGVDTVEVPPQMTAQARKGQRTRRKTDHTDALAIARVTAREDDLPAVRCDEAVDDLRSLVLYRRELVEARTAQINRLHADLTRLRPGYHKQLDSSGLAAPQALNRVSRLISRCPTARAQAR